MNKVLRVLNNVNRTLTYFHTLFNIGTFNRISFKQNNEKQYCDSLISTKNIETCYMHVYSSIFHEITIKVCFDE